MIQAEATKGEGRSTSPGQAAITTPRAPLAAQREERGGQQDDRGESDGGVRSEDERAIRNILILEKFRC